MAAKFGSILSDLSGDAGQILKVNSGGTEFEMATPPSLPSYTVTNETTDRVIDANDVTLDEVADVLSTLIKDMATIYNGGFGSFQWSTSEQVWPFEKSNSGATLYCKQVSLGALPNAGIKNVDLGLGSDIPNKTFKFDAWARVSSSAQYSQLSIANFGTTDCNFQLLNQYARIQSAIDFSSWDDAQIRIIYWK